jgi:hypothetical protein
MRSEITRVTGGCLCGNVRYQADVYLQKGTICHCSMCQKSSGQPAEITVFIKSGSLKYVKGLPKFFVSSAYGKRGFCADCGSRLVWQATDVDDDWTTNLDVGSLDNPAEVKVACHIYTDTQLPWFDICQGLPKFTEATADEMLKFINAD